MNLDKKFLNGFAVGMLFAAVLMAVFVSGMRAGRQAPQQHAETTNEEQPAPMPKRETSAQVKKAPVYENYEPPFQGTEAAPVEIIEFADFQCVFCHRAMPTMKKLVEQYPGKVKFVFRHYPLSATPGTGSFLQHEASMCAYDQNRFWQYHDRLFTFSGAPGREDLLQMARAENLDLQAFESCLDAGKYREIILKDRHRGNAMGVDGTPAFFVNEHAISGAYPFEYFQQVIEAELDPEKPLPVDLREPSSEPASFDLEGRPTQGPSDAPVTLVEFSDFHCPFCSRLRETLHQVMEQHAGKVRRVFFHFPLTIHPGADMTHQASECAHEQGKFWEFFEKIFDRPGAVQKEGLMEIGRQIGLDMEAYESCLQSEKYKQQILSDIAAGSAAGVQGTPAVFVNGKLIPGAQPYEVFDTAIQEALKSAS